MSLETLLITSALSSGTIVSEIIKQYAQRSKSAKEDYQKRSPTENDAIEKRRGDCITTINELQFDTALCVADPDLQQRIWCLLMEQTVLTYEAVTERELRMVGASLQQIKAALKSYRDGMNYRTRVRFAGVVISFVFLAAIGIYLYYAPRLGVSANSVITILGIPVSVLLWSVVGSFAAILYRFSMSGDRNLEDPLRWFFSRPLTGVVMGSITFLVIKVGVLTFASGSNAQPVVTDLGSKELMWLVAFLAGFSDRFSDGLLKSLIGRFGGDSSGELVTVGMTAMQQRTGSQFSVIFDWITKRGGNKNPTIPPVLNGNIELGQTLEASPQIRTNGSGEKTEDSNGKAHATTSGPDDEEQEHDIRQSKALQVYEKAKKIDPRE